MKQLAKILTDCLWTAPFLLIFSTVFVVSNDLANGVVSGKYFWFYGSMGLASVAIFIFSFINNKKSFRFSFSDLFVVLFGGSVYFSAYIFSDASQNTTKLTLFALLIALYFCFRLTINKLPKIQNICCIFIIFTGLIEAFWGLQQLYGFAPSQHNLFKLTGSFFNPGPYAGYLAAILPMSLYCLLSPSRLLSNTLRLLPMFLKCFGGITCFAILLVLPAAMSRAAWLATIAGCSVVIYKKYEKQLQIKQYYKKYKKHVLLIICLISLTFLLSLTALYHLKKDSADGRLLTWKISLQTVVKYPFGAGLGNFSGVYGDMQAAYFASGKASETEKHVAGNPEYGFDEYLQILIESGIVSFLLFAVIIVLAVRLLLRNNAGMAGSLIALLVFACFSYPFSVLPFPVIFVFFLASGNSAEQQKTGSRFASIITTCLCLLVSGVCLYREYPVYRAYERWNREKIYYGAGLNMEAAEAYGELYPYLDDRIQFLFEYAQSLSKSDQPEKSIKILQRAIQISCDPMLYNIMGRNFQSMQQYDSAEAAFIHSANLVPNRLYPWYLMMKLHAETGNAEKAVEAAKIVLTMEPKVQSQAVREMREEARKLVEN
ncbi:MAG: O-antigen ligase family protein [Dysgonamonadaceae bacterium]|nr:O-antigen ligase family protein [Dysgonamonadaceae bacterium]